MEIEKNRHFLSDCQLFIFRLKTNLTISFSFERNFTDDEQLLLLFLNEYKVKFNCNC